MEYRYLGRSGLQVSVLTMGTMTFGGSGVFAKVGNTDAAGATRQIDLALDVGVNLIDTANAYSGGLSEEIIGQAMKGRWNRTLIATIRLGDGGFNLGVSPDGQRVYATTAGGRVYVIATSSNTVVDSLTVGSAPNGVAFSPGGRTVYISSRDAGTVTAFNTSTLQQVAVYLVGGAPQRLAVSPSGSTLYAANEVHGLDVVNLSTGTVTEAAGLSTGYGLGQTPDGTQLWVTSPLEGVIYIVDPTTNSVTRTLNLGTEIVPRNVAFSADGKTAVVTNGAGSVLFFK